MPSSNVIHLIIPKMSEQIPSLSKGNYVLGRCGWHRGKRDRGESDDEGDFEGDEEEGKVRVD
jgi:hypothetical protein